MPTVSFVSKLFPSLVQNPNSLSTPFDFRMMTSCGCWTVIAYISCLRCNIYASYDMLYHCHIFFNWTLWEKKMLGLRLLSSAFHFVPCAVRQVDLQRILAMVPLPLSQGVLLSLLQQLACDISKDTSRKLAWMTDVAVALNPADPMIAVHVRPIFEQVYQILNHHRSLPSTSTTDLSSTRLLMHVINSMLMTCKWVFIFLPLLENDIK